jgi:propionyl-CoA carboxylase alpha chain/3-methylcrotonyl-CoA carboxylase alpha subunit
MFGSVLIANRGEIACRVIKTARRMGLRTIAVYSDADAKAPHVQLADSAIRIGPAPARESYLVAKNILSAAKASGAEAIHPGYGFLSENASFAQAVIDAGLIWIGPKPFAITAMGLKDQAKARMLAAGVPVTPGYMGDDQSDARLKVEADQIGYPVLIKAVAGGGGKGMRKVERTEDFLTALASCQREAAASFGDARVLLEVYVSRPRHIEVQVFGDSHGNVVHLYERDCSLQRRHQKVIEEAPAPGMDAQTRTAICDAAIRAAKAVDYEGAGTVEFIADASEGLRPDRIWFMEMNTRLQVEHPVTEAVTGLDLVEWQLRVAAGEPLPLTQDQISLSGHAIEARLYAENPATGFLPSIGRLERFNLPAHLRIDSGVSEGGEISPYYDPMIAKLIAHAPTRKAAAQRLADGCAAVEVHPVATNAAFLARTLADPDFLAGEIDTRFIEDRLDQLTLSPDPSDQAWIAAAKALARPADASPWQALQGFRLNAAPHYAVKLSSGAETRLVEIDPAQSCPATAWPLGDQHVVFEAGEAHTFRAPAPDALSGQSSGDGILLAPMPGKIVACPVKPGDTVLKGDPIITLEAMKMEHILTAPFDGLVEGLGAGLGDQVVDGFVLARLSPSAKRP